MANQDESPPARTSPKPSPQDARPRVPADRRVEKTDDWASLRTHGLTSVIDPTLVRVAELFLRGERAATAANWAVIEANLASLIAFVDLLVLAPGIPVFDYWYSFFGTPEFSDGDDSADSNRIFTTCAPVVVPISVGPEVWGPLRTNVFASMRNATAISSNAAESIEHNLSAMKWKFDPKLAGENLAVNPSSGDPSGKPLVNSYLYVALLFSAYAAQFGGTQVLSPDQSDALLLASSGARGLLSQLSDAGRLSARKPDQGGLFDKLNEVVGGEVTPVTLHRPCFLPYLVDRGARTPAELFAKAIAMRDEPEVRDYRAWMRDNESDLMYGKMADARVKEISAIAAALRRRSEPTTPNVQVGLFPLSAGIAVDLTRARDWLWSNWPGKRYRRLIQRLAISKKETFDLTEAVRRTWSNGAT
jgi:hypothetical protein